MSLSAPAQGELRRLHPSPSHPRWKPARVAWSGQRDASQTEQLPNPPVRTEEVKNHFVDDKVAHK